VAAGGGGGVDPLRDGELGDAPERTPGKRVVGRSGGGEAGRRTAVGFVLGDLVADPAAGEAVGDLLSGTGGDRCREGPQPVADELGALVAGLHLQPARAVVLQPVAFAVAAPVGRFAECGDQPQVEKRPCPRELVEHSVPPFLQ